MRLNSWDCSKSPHLFWLTPPHSQINEFREHFSTTYLKAAKHWGKEAIILKTKRGSNLENRASEEDVLSTPPPDLG